jgi:predicted phosphoadenosine phosphosulfate sulfurtransferase
MPAAYEKRRQTRPKRALSVDVYTLALERAANTLASFDHVAVGFSGGKDSTAVLNVTREVAHSDPRFARHLPLRFIFWDEEAIPVETEQYVRRMFSCDDIAGEWYCLPVKHRNACSRKSPWWWPWAPEAEAKWCRPLPPEAITGLPGFPVWPPEARLSIPDANGLFMPPRLGNCALLMGIRAQESLTRLRAVTRRPVENYLIKLDGGTCQGNIWKSYPVYDWTTEDVWTAPAKFGWDYNCNVHESPIWMADFSFKPIGEVRPGDEIIGWEPAAGRRAAQGTQRNQLARATVIATHKRHSKVVKVTMESGRTIRCTPDHLWMHYRCGHSRPDGAGGSTTAFAPPGVGHNLCHIVDVPDPTVPDPRAAAWLGGIYDGEGCGDRIYQSPHHNPEVYAAIEEALNKLDIPYAQLNGRSAAQHGFRVANGRAGLVKFLNMVQPVKRVGGQTDQVILGGRFRTPDKIVAIEDAGEADVYALTTTTGNYVCWGYASKNSAYDRMEMAGVPASLQRCSPAFGEEPLQKLHTYASCFPDVWGPMTERVPGVGAAARYALTELYCYRDRPQKPAGMPWPEFVMHYARQFRPQDTRFIADRLREEIRLHYRKVTQPISETAPHPATGVSWDFLLMLAMRGDFKSRKQAGARVQNDDQGQPLPRFWHRYARELAGIIDAGRFADLAYPGPQPADPWALVPAYALEEAPA